MLWGRQFLRAGIGARALVLSAAIAVSGCVTASTQNPDRLYPVAVEMDGVRYDDSELLKRYSDTFLTDPRDAKLIRNEIIAQRMYAIDMYYTQYEAALTRERQEIGFGALTTAGGLSTAATLAASAATKSVLSALATGVIAVKGNYESEVLLSQTMRTLQKQMRASRNVVSEHISTRVGASVAEYPLAEALGDVEDYYRAGTVTTAVIDMSTTVGIEEQESKKNKQDTARLPAAARAAATIPDTVTPIPTPVVLPPRLNAEGIGDFEQRVSRANIIVMQKVVGMCNPTGELTATLRARVIDKLGSDKRDPRDRITNMDFQLVKRKPATTPCT